MADHILGFPNYTMDVDGNYLKVDGNYLLLRDALKGDQLPEVRRQLDSLEDGTQISSSSVQGGKTPVEKNGGPKESKIFIRLRVHALLDSNEDNENSEGLGEPSIGKPEDFDLNFQKEK